MWVPFWACFGVPGGSKKGFLLFFLGLFFGGACSFCGSLFGLVLGPRGALRNDFFCFFWLFFGGERVLVVGPFVGLFWGPGGL